MAEENLKPKRLDERLFERTAFILPWFVFLVLVVRFVSWPIRNFVLVCWVYGSNAYFHDGIRVLSVKPIRFSNGVRVPTLPDLVTGFGALFITVIGLTALLALGLRFFERRSEQKKQNVVR